MKKFLSALALCAALCFLLSCSTLAAEDQASTAATSQTESTTRADGTDSFFVNFYEQIILHLPEVFSALSLAGACTVALGYKKGLLPILRDGIGAIGSATKEWGKTAENYSKEAKEICEKANSYMHFVESGMQNAEETLHSICERLTSIETQKDESEKLKLLLRGQLDMLCDIFLSSSLPQFEKDRVSHRVEALKATLGENTGGGEEHASE